MSYLKTRRIRKTGHEVLRHSHHLHNMREDVLAEKDIEELRAKEQILTDALKSRQTEAIEAASDSLYDAVGKLAPKRSFPSIRENLEIAVVAVVVAMAFRTYFVQPFKIPTGSMQPTLNGIISNGYPPGTQSIMDHYPLKIVKWMVCGQWYSEIRAKVSGRATADVPSRAISDPSSVYFNIGGVKHKIPKSAALCLSLSDYVEKGTLLWAGTRTAGDHVFVNKLRWNFCRPKRGDIVVFNTSGISGLVPDTHYIKRLIGLPGRTVSIHPPNVLVNDEVVTEPDSIGRIARMEGEYDGYQLVDATRPGSHGSLLKSSSDRIHLGAKEYFVLGDNTRNSRDGRYWGTVPQANLVGPAVFVYWPFSRRWGRAE